MNCEKASPRCGAFIIEDRRSHKWIADGEGKCRNLNASSLIYLPFQFPFFIAKIKTTLPLPLPFWQEGEKIPKSN